MICLVKKMEMDYFYKFFKKNIEKISKFDFFLRAYLFNLVRFFNI